MIRILLQGRLGNHLFQVANGLALAEKNNTSLVIDASKLYHIKNQNQFKNLPIFSFDFPHKKSSVGINELCLRCFGKSFYQIEKNPLFTEESHDWDPQIINLESPLTLDGYFQCERYFYAISDQIRSYFDLSPWLQKAPYGLRLKAEQKKSVAVHVRRTDYLEYTQFYVCDMEYYHRALKEIRNSLDNPHFLVFSDDPSWCRNQFAGSEFTIVDNLGKPHNDLIDMALMSRCEHQIIANSSFSWWSAWLNKNPERIVIAPDRWTSENNISITTKNMNGMRVIASNAR